MRHLVIIALAACAQRAADRPIAAPLPPCADLDFSGRLGDPDRDRCGRDELHTGRAAQALGLDDLALYYYQRAVFYAPDLAAAHGAAAELFRARAETRRACESFARALVHDRSNHVARRALAECAAELGIDDPTLASAAECSDPADLDCWCAIGRAVIDPHGPPLPAGLTRARLAETCPRLLSASLADCEARLSAGDCWGAAEACHASVVAWPESDAALKGWRRAQSCVVAAARCDAGVRVSSR